MDLAPFSLEMPGFCNDNNVLQRSPLFAKLAMGESVPVEFKANSHILGYYLAYGIYPKWVTFYEATCQNPRSKRT
jgi:hypothetical protein